MIPEELLITPGNVDNPGDGMTRTFLWAFIIIMVSVGLSAILVLTNILANGPVMDLNNPGHMVRTTTQCQEDDPCWDCNTMGNHICGTLP